MQTDFQKDKIIIVSNRCPISDFKKGSESVSVGGLASALHRVAMQSDADWVFCGDQSQVELLSKFQPPGLKYKLHPVAVTEKEYKAYYGGYSNSLLWPLFHYSPDKSTFRGDDWDYYKDINKRIADYIAVIAKANPNALIWIQDYHLFLVAKYLRRQGVENRIGFFLHIPFPTYEIFRLLPQREQVMEALLYVDLLGFHTFGYVANFLRNVRRFVPESKIDEYAGRTSFIEYLGRKVRVSAYPISIDAKMVRELTKNQVTLDKTKSLESSLQAKFVGLGVDRLDYSKGIPEKLKALEFFFRKYSKYRNKVTFIQIAVPSRSTVKEYQVIQEELEQTVSRINGQYGTLDWQPIIYINRFVPFEELVSYYQMADFCLITPIRDGMNLVAKEFAIARKPNSSLILSELAGAAEELNKVSLVNPYNEEQTAEAIKYCLENPEAQNEILEEYKDRILINDVHAWTTRFLNEVHNISNAPKKPEQTKVPQQSKK